MSYHAEKSRLSFSEFLVRLKLYGWRLLSMHEFNGPKEPMLEVVIVNGANLALTAAGEITNPHWAEKLFYELASKLELFGDRQGA